MKVTRTDGAVIPVLAGADEAAPLLPVTKGVSATATSLFWTAKGLPVAAEVAIVGEISKLAAIWFPTEEADAAAASREVPDCRSRSSLSHSGLFVFGRETSRELPTFLRSCCYGFQLNKSIKINTEIQDFVLLPLLLARVIENLTV